MVMTFKLSSDLDKRLTKIAEKTHRSKNYHAQKALEAYIEDLEDYYLALYVLKKTKKTYTLKAVEKLIDK